MDFKQIYTSSRIHLLAILIFLTITVVYFYPVLEGKVLHTNDGTVAKNASKEIRDFREETGREALWTNSMFSGMPAYLISTRYPGNLIRFADYVLKIFRMPVAAIFLTMLGFYILLLIFRVKPWLAIAGAIVYGLSTYFFFILAAGHNTKAIAIAYMAPMIGSVYYTYRYNAVKGALLTGFFLSLQLFANHPQITYYAFICLLVFLIVEFIYSVKNREIAGFFKKSAILSIPVILAVGMNLGFLYTTYEYGKYSIRGKSELVSENKIYTSGLNKDYATQWSYGIDETMTLLIPNFKGGANIPFDKNSETVTTLRKNNAGQYASQIWSYWGTQPWTDGPVYVGAITVFLFILGLLIIKGPEKWWLLIATLLSVTLAWGKNFMPLTNLFMDYFPGYNKFRAVTMILVIAEFCIPLLAILTLRDIFDGKSTGKDFLKAFKIALGISGGITLLFVFFPGLAGSFQAPYEVGQVPDWLSASLKSDRQALLRGDAYRSLAFIFLAAAVLLAYNFNKLKKEHAILIIGFLFLTDMFVVDKRYLNSDKFVTPAVSRKSSAPSLADNIILKDTSYYRVLNLSVSPFNDATTSLFHKSVGGYHGAKIRRYNELIDSVLYSEISRIGNAARKAATLSDLSPVTDSLYAFNMLNTKYIILNPQSPPLLNLNANGNAWFADSLSYVDGANNELSGVMNLRSSHSAVVAEEFRPLAGSTAGEASGTDTIYLKSYMPNELKYAYKSENERVLIFSEIYYPAGWTAYLDGQKTDYFRANYVLRGMKIPAGSHEIVFRFHPSSYFTGNSISLASSLIYILLAAGYLAKSLLTRKEPANDSAQ